MIGKTWKHRRHASAAKPNGKTSPRWSVLSSLKMGCSSTQKHLSLSARKKTHMVEIWEYLYMKNKSYVKTKVEISYSSWKLINLKRALWFQTSAFTQGPQGPKSCFTMIVDECLSAAAASTGSGAPWANMESHLYERLCLFGGLKKTFFGISFLHFWGILWEKKTPCSILEVCDASDTGINDENDGCQVEAVPC